MVKVNESPLIGVTRWDNFARSSTISTENPTYQWGAFSEYISVEQVQFWRVPAERHHQEQTPISSAPSVGRVRRRRDFPFRPYFHARIPRITVVEQLPQIMHTVSMYSNPFRFTYIHI